MFCHVAQHVPFPAEVFHELRRQFDRIPFHAVDAGDAQVLDTCQKMMQAVTELVEQGDDFVMGKQRRLAWQRRSVVAVEIGHRRLDAVALPAPCDGVVHPGAAALAGAGIEVEVELADLLAAMVGNLEEFHVLMPHWRLGRADMQAIDGFHHLEHAGQHVGLGEILLYLMV